MTKCPECGFEIPDGQMYCSGCGWEVKLVPEFEPEIETRIDKTLSRLGDKIEDAGSKAENNAGKGANNAGKQAKPRKPSSSVKRTEKPVFPFGPVLALTAAVLILAGIVLFLHKTPEEYQRAAQREASRGNAAAAIENLDRAIEKDAKNGALLLQKAQYQAELANDPAAAVSTLNEILNSAAFPEADVEQAYSACAGLYLAQNDYDSLYALLEGCPYGAVLEAYGEYLLQAPVADPAEGTFAGEVTIALSADETAAIYYTTDGSEPDTASYRYEQPVKLEGEGALVVKAVAVSEKGAKSGVASFSYTLEEKPVPEPNVLEDSGVYTEPTKIVVTAGQGLTIRYTTDEDEVPDRFSEEYTEPIEMPEGESVFCFVACDENGRCSEVVVRRYTREAKHTVSPEEAVFLVKQALIGAGYMSDADGRVNGMEGYLTYSVDQTVRIGNDGNFYYIREIHVHADGIQEDTGRLYAVHTESGMTKRLGYDSRGKIMLMHF